MKLTPQIYSTQCAVGIFKSMSQNIWFCSKNWRRVVKYLDSIKYHGTTAKKHIQIQKTTMCILSHKYVHIICMKINAYEVRHNHLQKESAKIMRKTAEQRRKRKIVSVYEWVSEWMGQNLSRPIIIENDTHTHTHTPRMSRTYSGSILLNLRA